jgi:hypothetical protein
MLALLERLRPFRAVAIAIIVLVVSAGIVLAASGGTHGSANSHAQGHGPTASGEPDESDSPDESGAPQDAHGALVSAAAHMTTPAGFRNHGAFVSCVAHLHDVTIATVDWSSITPASCGAKAPESSEAP